MLKKFRGEIVCVDSTHGTNSYNFKLITVLVVDDFGEGCPVAWCISNREDFTTLRKIFLLIIYIYINNTDTSITSNFFMNDDAPAFYNVMGGRRSPRYNCSFYIRPVYRKRASKEFGVCLRSTDSMAGKSVSLRSLLANQSDSTFKNKGLFSVQDLKPDNEITDSVINHDLTSLQELFTTQAWEEVEKIITLKQNF
ncbi:c2H2-type domain-containing protein [Trichonephila clavipes]|nr:c2H2-type domain-containing protein [Trichonephila clavipes]